MLTLINGFCLGLAYAIPIGALNVFVVQSAVLNRRELAYQTALAVTLMDVSLGLACYFGVGAVFAYLPILKPILLAAGAIFLLKTGGKLLIERATLNRAAATPAMARSIWRSALVLTWLNPHALLDGTILLGGIRASVEFPSLFLAGALVALPVWYFSIVTLVRLLRERFSDSVFTVIQRICGGVLIYFGIRFALTLAGVLR